MSNPTRSGVLSILSVSALLVSVLVVGYLIGLHGPVPAMLTPGKVAATEPDPTEPRIVTPREDLAASERSVIELFERCSASVVHVNTMAQVRESPFSRNFQEVPAGAGSGIVWDEAGHIVTNLHVVANSSAIAVTLYDGSTYPVVTVVTFADKDLAVLTIDAPAEQLKPLALGTSHDLRVGQTVFAIGNPYGFDATLTHGLISAVGRQIQSLNDRDIHDVIQTDAAINPGNSGGPLLDSSGRLIGVNTQIFSPTGTSAGIGFAIPVDDVRRIVEQLISTGKVIRPGLGITTGDADRLIQWNDLPGVPIWDVPADSAAATAGLKGLRQRPNGSIMLGDMILKVGETPTPDTNALKDALEAYQIGETVTLTIQRDGREITVPVTLQAIS